MAEIPKNWAIVVYQNNLPYVFRRFARRGDAESQAKWLARFIPTTEWKVVFIDTKIAPSSEGG